MTWTKSGSVNLTNGNAVVYGTGTAWVSGGMARPGDVMIAPNGALYEVASIQSNTQLTLSSAYLGSTASDQSYSLIHTGLLPSELAINLSSLQSKYLTTISQLWEWETSNEATVPLTNPATGVTTNVKPIARLALDMSGKAPVDSPTFSGNVHVGVKGSSGRLFLNATDSTREGGELVFCGAASYSDWIVDSNGADLRVYTSGAGSFLVVTPNGLGYGLGAGGTVTQPTSKSTAVVLNKPCGQITMHNSTLAAGAYVEFTLNSTCITPTDTVIVNMIWAVGPGYRVEVSAVGVHAAVIRITNILHYPLSESVPLNFAVIKGATS